MMAASLDVGLTPAHRCVKEKWAMDQMMRELVRQVAGDTLAREQLQG